MLKKVLYVRTFFEIKFIHIISNAVLLFNSFMTDSRIMYKPVHGFILQVNGLVSIW